MSLRRSAPSRLIAAASRCRPAAALAAAILLALLPASQAQEEERIENPVAVFTGLDKITARIVTFDVYIDETVQFGALQVTPRVCFTRPETEVQKTTAFVEVNEITLNEEVKKLFMGWMFASSPALNAIEHPVYDVWLEDCKQQSDVPPPSARQTEQAPATTQ